MIKIIPVYIARNYLKSFLLTLAVIFSILYIIDILEIVRRYSQFDISYSKLLRMAFCRSTGHLQVILPFIIMIASIALIARLNMQNEIVIMRSMRMPVYQIISYVSLTSIVIGIIYLSVINPINASLLKKYESFEARYLKDSPGSFMISNSGLWLKRELPTGDINIINALRISQDTSEIFDIRIYNYNKEQRAISNWQAKKARVEDKKWILEDVEMIDDTLNKKYTSEMILPIDINLRELHNSISSPRTISFWQLPYYISLSKRSGFATNMHELYFFSLLFAPLYFASLAAFGAIFAFASVRYGKLQRSIVKGMFAGFIVYFFNNLMQTFSIAAHFPASLAAILPVIIVSSVAAWFILHFEEEHVI